MLAFTCWACLLVIEFLEATSLQGLEGHRSAVVNKGEALAFALPIVVAAGLGINIYWCVVCVGARGGGCGCHSEVLFGELSCCMQAARAIRGGTGGGIHASSRCCWPVQGPCRLRVGQLRSLCPAKAVASLACLHVLVT